MNCSRIHSARLHGQEWKEVRNKFRVIRGRVEKTLVDMGYMDGRKCKAVGKRIYYTELSDCH